MKKSVVFIILIALSLSIFGSIFIRAQEADSPVDEQQLQQMQDTINKLPLTESGELDPTKLDSYKSQAELRIEKINLFLDKLSWLKYVFGMKPEISFLFLIDILLIIVFLVYLRNALAFSNFSDRTCVIITFALTLFIIQTGLIVTLSKLIVKLLTSWWFYLIVIVIFVIISKLGTIIGKIAKQKKNREREEKLNSVAKNAPQVAKGARDAQIVSVIAESIEEGLGDDERTTKDEF